MTQFETVQGTTEKTLSLNDIFTQSPYTILYFYPKDNTPGCTVEAQDFTKLIEEFKELDIQIVGVSKDSLKSHCNFISKHGLKALYISDPDLVLHNQYEARGEKNNYGKIVQGVIRSTILIDSKGNTLKHRKNVRAKGHAERVLKESKEILA